MGFNLADYVLTRWKWLCCANRVPNVNLVLSYIWILGWMIFDIPEIRCMNYGLVMIWICLNLAQEQRTPASDRGKEKVVE